MRGGAADGCGNPQPQLRNEQEVLAAVRKVLREEAASGGADEEEEPVRKTSGRKPKYTAERAQKWNGGR
jgi:hypothetical protein